MRIHDILVWILIQTRIRILLFCHWPSRCQQKTNFSKVCFAYYFSKVHLHHFQRKKVKKKSQSIRTRFFLLFLLGDRRIRIQIQEAYKHMDPVDPIRILNTEAKAYWCMVSAMLTPHHKVPIVRPYSMHFLPLLRYYLLVFTSGNIHEGK